LSNSVLPVNDMKEGMVVEITITK